MRTYTTGQVALICKAAPRTVSKWFDEGWLRGYRVPGSQKRYIPHSSLVTFMKDRGMPLGDLEQEDEAVKVLLFSTQESVLRPLQRHLTGLQDFYFRTADLSFEGGCTVAEFRPNVIVMDLLIGKPGPRWLCAQLKQHVHYGKAIFIGIRTTSLDDAMIPKGFFAETYKPPFDPALLAIRARTLIAQR